MLTTLKTLNLILKGNRLSQAAFFASWRGGGNSTLVKRFRHKEHSLVDEKSNRKFSVRVKELVGNNLETLRVAIDEFNLTQIGNAFWVFPIPDQSQIKIKLANHSSLQVIFEIFREEIYSFFTTEKCCVIDVGANIGIASVYFATLPNVSKVFSYELVPSTFQLAIENIKASSLENIIVIKSVGIAIENGKFTIPFEEEGSVDASVYEVSRSIEKSKSGNTIEVEVVSATAEFQDILKHVESEKLILKLDCEGTEYEVIPELATKGVLQKFTVVMLEWHYHGPELLLKILTDNGFFAFNRNIPNDGGKRGMIYAVKIS
jgi:FkbM family methyltransferase